MEKNIKVYNVTLCKMRIVFANGISYNIKNDNSVYYLVKYIVNRGCREREVDKYERKIH